MQHCRKASSKKSFFDFFWNESEIWVRREYTHKKENADVRKRMKNFCSLASFAGNSTIKKIYIFEPNIDYFFSILSLSSSYGVALTIRRILHNIETLSLTFFARLRFFDYPFSCWFAYAFLCHLFVICRMMMMMKIPFLRSWWKKFFHAFILNWKSFSNDSCYYRRQTIRLKPQNRDLMEEKSKKFFQN